MYLGILLNYNGVFTNTQKMLSNQGKKAVFSLFSKIQDDYFNTETLLSLFDTYVKNIVNYGCEVTGTCFIQKIYAPSSSLLQGKHLPFSPSPLRLNIFRLFVILSLTQLYRYTPKIFLFSTATFKYIYRAPLRQIGQE
jgi:hypothetical protein